MPSQNYTFRGDSQGHGLDANARFLRSQGALSLIVVLIITDQDDCSTHDLTTFTADANVGRSCLAHPDKLRAIQTYVGGLRALRPDDEQLLLFGVIAGVPPEWVETVLEPARRGFGDPTLLRAAFDGLLTDPRMQADPGNMMPSCSSATATATAPRRLMQFARDVGEGAYVQSICDYDLARMFADMLDIAAKRLGSWGDACPSMPVVPDGQGLLPCRITWELPEHADPEEPLTPVSCAERPGVLSEPGPDFPRRSKHGRVLCEVRQAPVLRGSDGSIAPQGDGFFREPSRFCPAERGLRIAFTERAKPPTGVTVSMECLDETQRAGAKLPGVPAIGDPCLQWETLQSSDGLCGNSTGERSAGKLFCNTQSNRCVLGCSEDRECPPEWVCDSASRSCIKPGCD